MLLKDPSFRVPAYEAAKGRRTFVNPLMRVMGNPWIPYDPGTGCYYANRDILPQDGCGIYVNRSRSLPDIEKDRRMVFRPNEDVGLYRMVWASELHRIGEKWYIYGGASCHPTLDWQEGMIRTFVLESRTGDPFDGFDFAGLITGDDEAIDATVFQCRNGKNYLCFSRCLEQDRGKLMIQEMESPVKLKGEPVCICRASYPRETVAPYDGDQRIAEGAVFLTHGERTFCIYTVNGCDDDAYCLWVMELMGDDPMNQSAWVKDDEPWLVSGYDLSAPGHPSVFSSPDGKEMYLAYHAREPEYRTDREGPHAGYRKAHCFIKKIYFDETGFPHAGEAARWGFPVPVPSGDPG